MISCDSLFSPAKKKEPDFHCAGRETIAGEVGFFEVLYVSE